MAMNQMTCQPRAELSPILDRCSMIELRSAKTNPILAERKAGLGFATRAAPIDWPLIGLRLWRMVMAANRKTCLHRQDLSRTSKPAASIELRFVKTNPIPAEPEAGLGFTKCAALIDRPIAWLIHSPRYRSAAI